MQDCTVCRHPQVMEITAALAAGASLGGVAERFGLKKGAVFRHKAKHFAPVPVATGTLAEPSAETETEVEPPRKREPVVAKIRALQDRTLELLRQAEQVGDRAGAVRLIQEARRNLELEARLTGELEESSASEGGKPVQVNVIYVDAKPGAPPRRAYGNEIVTVQPSAPAELPSPQREEGAK